MTPLLHIRPDDFTHVRGASAWLAAVANAAGESALTGLLFEHPRGRPPARYVDRVARCVVWLAKRGVFYDRFEPSYVHPGLFVSGMSAWRHGPNDEATLTAYWATIGPQVTSGEDTTAFDAAVRSYSTAGGRAPLLPPVPVPLPVPIIVGPTGRLVAREWWEDIEVVRDMTRRTTFDNENGPFVIHIAAEGRLDGRAVYIELVDEPIYQQYYRPLLEATHGFLLEPLREEAIPLDRIPAAWQAPWRAALDEDVRERVEEERVIAQLRATGPGSAALTEKKYRIRTIEPLGATQVPFASGRLRLLMYDALPTASPVDLFSEPYAGVEALGAVTRAIFRAAQQSGVGGLVLDGASLDRLVLPSDGGQLAWCGLGRFVPWPVYCSYAKRATHGFYSHVLDDEPPVGDDVVDEEPPYHLIVQYGPTFAQSWKTAAQRYNAGDRDVLAATLAERTGLMAPPEDADDAGDLIVMGVAMTEGQTATQFKDSVATLRTAWLAQVSAHYAALVDRQLTALLTYWPVQRVPNKIYDYYVAIRASANLAGLVDDFVHGRFLGDPAHYALGQDGPPLLPSYLLAREAALRDGTVQPDPTDYTDAFPEDRSGSAAIVTDLIGSPLIRACTSISKLFEETGFHRVRTHSLDALRWLETLFIATALGGATPGLPALGWLSRSEASPREELADYPRTQEQWAALTRAFATPTCLGMNVARGRTHTCAIDPLAALRDKNHAVQRQAIGKIDPGLCYGPACRADDAVWLGFRNNKRLFLRLDQATTDDAFFTLLGEAILDDSYARPVQPSHLLASVLTHVAKPENVLGPGQPAWDLGYDPMLVPSSTLAPPLKATTRGTGKYTSQMMWFAHALLHESGALAYGAMRDVLTQFMASRVPTILVTVLGESSFHLRNVAAREGWLLILNDVLRGDVITTWDEEEGGLLEDQVPEPDDDPRRITDEKDVFEQLSLDLSVTKAVRRAPTAPILPKSGEEPSASGEESSVSQSLCDDDEASVDEDDIPDGFPVVFEEMLPRAKRYNPLNVERDQLPM